MLVLAGTVWIGSADLSAGDYLFTEPGEEHDVLAVTDAVIFVYSPPGFSTYRPCRLTDGRTTVLEIR